MAWHSSSTPALMGFRRTRRRARVWWILRPLGAGQDGLKLWYVLQRTPSRSGFPIWSDPRVRRQAGRTRRQREAFVRLLLGFRPLIFILIFPRYKLHRVHVFYFLNTGARLFIYTRTTTNRCG
jgi:hypothetical protein